MHAVSHSLAQRAHRAPPATRTRARWQPYNSVSARSSPAAYLTPASSVSSASPTPPQAVTSYNNNDRLRNGVPPPFVIPHSRELQPRDAQKSKYVIGLVDQAVKSLCEIWHPQDIPLAFMTSSRAAVPVDRPGEQPMPHSRGFSRNSQLLSPLSPSTQPSPVASQFTPTHTAQQPDAPAGNQCNLVPIKGFVHEVLRRSRTSGCVLQTALCYLEAIRAKVPQLVEKEKTGDGVQGEPDLANRIIQGDLEAEEWRELSLDSIMADFIHLDAAVDSGSAGAYAMATVRVVDGDGGDDVPQSISLSSFPSSQSLSSTTTYNEDFTMNGLKSHLVQNLTKKSKAPSDPLPPLAPLPSPLLCPRRTFLASLILASKFTQDRCYSNKAWAKLSGLPPREIGRCERALGDALEWRLWVGKSPASSSTAPPSSNNRAVVRSKSDGELLANRGQSDNRGIAEFSSPPPPPQQQQQQNTTGAGLRRAATLPAAGFSQDILLTASANSEVPWEPLSWTPPTIVSSGAASVNESPSTPSLCYSPSSTESSSGDRTIQMSSFIDVTPSPGQFVPLGTGEKSLHHHHHHLSSETHAAAYAYAAQHHHDHVVLDVDPTSGLAIPSSYTFQGVNAPFVYDPSAAPDALYSHWTV